MNESCFVHWWPVWLRSNTDFESHGYGPSDWTLDFLGLWDFHFLKRRGCRFTKSKSTLDLPSFSETSNWKMTADMWKAPGHFQSRLFGGLFSCMGPVWLTQAGAEQQLNKFKINCCKMKKYFTVTVKYVIDNLRCDRKKIGPFFFDQGF